MTDNDVYVDPWVEYRNISTKLRKRFLRKPNLSEASRQFNQLANRFKDDEVWSYAGFTKLAVARCEHSQGNIPGETWNLAEAGRFFLQAEREKHDLHLPSFQENLASAVHCYGHAIRVHLEQGNPDLATNYCLELGEAIYMLGRPFEAIEHFQRAAYLNSDPDQASSSKGFRSPNVWSHVIALKWIVVCQIDACDYCNALDSVRKLDTYARSKMGGVRSDQPIIFQASKFLTDVLADCEILCVLLITRLELLEKCMVAEQKALYERYTEIVLPSDLARKLESSFLDENLFISLQSYVLALKDKDIQQADQAMTQMWPCVNPCVQELLFRVLKHFDENLRAPCP